MVNVGVIGTGGMGARHAHNLAHHTPGGRLSAVMDLDRERAKAVADACGDVRVHADASALLSDAHVDAVVITSPDFTHAALTVECLSLGKPVLCEKPLAVSAAEAFTVIEAEVAAGKRLVQLGFMREYDPAHQEVMRIVESGKLGRPLVFRGVHVNKAQGRPRTVDDVITNSAIHDVHSARFMMPSEIARVNASCIAAGGPQTSRFALIELTYRDGGLGIIQCNADSGYGYEVDVEITCERGVAHANTLRGATLRGAGTLSTQIAQDWLERFETAYRIEAQAWVRSIIDDAPAGPSAWDGYASLLVADKCIESANSGAPCDVEIPERPELYRSEA